MNEEKEMINSIKLRVANVIIDLNLIESKITKILARYIDSKKDHFVRNVLLNSLNMSLAQKFKIMKTILKTEKVKPPEDLFKAITIVMNKRNIIAHSDSLLQLDVDFEDMDFDDEGSPSPIFKIQEPSVNSGQADPLVPAKLTPLLRWP